MPIAAAIVLLLLALPASAGAVLPGVNGKISFTSGRNQPSDATAQIWIVDQPGGVPTQATNNLTAQHRHSHWSPDYTRLVYAFGPGFVGPYDLYVLDLTQPMSATNPLNITNSGGSEDRPSWSPDGTRIAYEARVGGVQDVYVRTMATGAVTKLSNAPNANQDAGKPAWSPDSQTIYYSLDMDPDPGAGAGNVDNDILKQPAGNTNGAGATNIINNPGTDDYQPAVSPDGQNLCFTRGPFGTTGATVHRSDANGGSIGSVHSSGNGDYNCVWSPDGTKIGFVTGIFTAGALVMKNANGTGSVDPIVNDVAGRFDGNPDWARNGPPTCSASNIVVEKNTPTTVQLSCVDPPPENGSTTKSIVAAPPNGTLGTVQQGQPATVLYTPKKDFRGFDNFTFKGNDGVSDSATATVGITVRDTKAATISSFSRGNARWRRGPLLPAFIAQRLAPVGTTITYRIDEQATVSLKFELVLPGRLVGKKCKAPTRSRRFRPRCNRYFNKGSITRSRPAGRSRMRFQGRLTRTRRLALGRYRVTISAVDLAGNRSKTRSAFFTIVLFR